MNLFTNLAISRKILVAFALSIIVVCSSGLYIRSSLNALQDSVEANKNSIRINELTDEMLSHVIQQENALRGYAMLGRPELLEEYEGSRGDFDKAAAEFAASTKLPDQRARLDKLKVEIRDLQDRRFAELIELAARPETRVKAQEISGRKQLPKVRQLIAEMTARQAEVIAERRAEQQALKATANFGVWASVGFTVLVAFVMGTLLARTIATPLRAMTDTMTRLAQGDNGVDVPAVDSGDELGQMAKTVLVFKENAIAKAQADAAVAAALDEQKLVTASLRDSLEALTQGDLTASIEVGFPAAYAELKTNFNAALDSLRGLIGSVNESASQIRTGSTEIAGASEDLARRTEGNAASLEETSAALVQIDGRLKASASASVSTVARADQAIATVGGGRAIADEAVQAMGRVSDSAKGIDSVIEGLDKIAFQTRVLAMNAAVEAGRAGDAGRGFAVVADLVSALAMRAEEEAKRARDQLTVTQTDIVTAVEAVRRVDGALANISGDVGEVHKLLGGMAEDNQAQSAAITQITAAIGSMDQSTQENAAMVEETSAAARNLTAEVANLADKAAAFKVDGGAARTKPAAIVLQPKAAVKPARGYVSPVKALPAAPKSKAKPLANGHDDDNWAAF